MEAFRDEFMDEPEPERGEEGRLEDMLTADGLDRWPVHLRNAYILVVFLLSMNEEINAWICVCEGACKRVENKYGVSQPLPHVVDALCHAPYLLVGFVRA